jgi:hypothetical protein
MHLISEGQLYSSAVSSRCRTRSRHVKGLHSANQIIDSDSLVDAPVNQPLFAHYISAVPNVIAFDRVMIRDLEPKCRARIIQKLCKSWR